jgi:hypothetical protein
MPVSSSALASIRAIGAHVATYLRGLAEYSQGAKLRIGCARQQ